MDGMSQFPTDQWMQPYPSTTMAPSDDATLVYRDSSHGSTGPKPIRRRSRASRRTPVTVLNASPTDFRALVQRFTGCDSKDHNIMVPPSAVNLPKGPVNIDFTRNHDAIEESSSSWYTYLDNPVRPSLQAEQVGGWRSPLQAGYGMETAYESIDESLFMATHRDGGNQGYNV